MNAIKLPECRDHPPVFFCCDVAIFVIVIDGEWKGGWVGEYVCNWHPTNRQGKDLGRIPIQVRGFDILANSCEFVPPSFVVLITLVSIENVRLKEIKMLTRKSSLRMWIHVVCGLLYVGYVYSSDRHKRKSKRASAVGTRYVLHVGRENTVSGDSDRRTRT